MAALRSTASLPARGPRSGGTMITIKGAGFFKNSTSSYNPSAPNCGVPTKNPDQTVVTAQCRLVAQLTGETVFGTIAFIVDHQTIMCTTGNTVNHDQESSQYSLSVRSIMVHSLLQYHSHTMTTHQSASLSSHQHRHSSIVLRPSLSSENSSSIPLRYLACLRDSETA